MSLTIEPKKGIRLSFDQYSPIKTWQGGGKFWEHDFQLTVRQGMLQEFLPRVTDEGGGVLYEQVVDGAEVVSESIAPGVHNQVPAPQVERLRRALAELKAKAEDPHCDANKRRMIEAFRLPDPQKDAELYRLYGSGRKKRLLVLWGVEKEAGSAIAPMKAIERMPSKALGSVWTNWLWRLLLLLGLAIAAWFLLGRRSGGNTSSTTVPPTTIVPSASPREGFPPAASDPGRAHGPEISPQATPNSSSGSSSGREGATATNSGPARVVDKTDQLAPSATPLPYGAAMTNAATNSMSAGPGADKGDEPAGREKDSSLPPDSSPGTGEARPGNSPAQGHDGGPEKPPSASSNPSSTNVGTVGESVVPTPTPALLPDTIDQNSANGSGKSAPPASPTPEALTDPANVSGSSPAVPTPARAESDGAPDVIQPRGTPAEPTVAATGATRIDISAVPQGETVNEQLTVLLAAAGQNRQGALVSDGVRVTRWLVDNIEQRAGSGALLTGATLPVTLNKGVHRVVVEGESGNKPIRAEADIDVSLILTTKSAVTVRPLTQ